MDHAGDSRGHLVRANSCLTFSNRPMTSGRRQLTGMQLPFGNWWHSCELVDAVARVQRGPCVKHAASNRHSAATDDDDDGYELGDVKMRRL